MENNFFSEITVDELISIATYLFIFVVIVIILNQYFKLKRYKLLVKKLAKVFQIKSTRGSNNYDVLEKILKEEMQKRKKSLKSSDNVKNYIEQHFKEYKIFIHYTSEIQIAEKILNEGFKYSESIYKTSQEIVNSSVDLTYKLQIYRPYGDYLVVICVPKIMFSLLQKSDNTDQHLSIIDNFLCEFQPEDDLEYNLPPMFIAGYIDMVSKKIYDNEQFMKGFDIETYKTKLLNS